MTTTKCRHWERMCRIVNCVVCFIVGQFDLTLLFIEVNLPVTLPSAGVSSLNQAMWSAVLLQELEFHLQFVEERN